MITFKQFIIEQAMRVTDGNYVAIGVKNPVNLPIDIDSVIPSVDQHVTLIHSEGTFVNHEHIKSVIQNNFPETIVAQGTTFDCFDSTSDTSKSSLVMLLRSEVLDHLHVKLWSLGCIHSHDNFKPHISFAHGLDAQYCKKLKTLLNKVMKFPITVYLSGITTESIKE